MCAMHLQVDPWWAAAPKPPPKISAEPSVPCVTALIVLPNCVLQNFDTAAQAQVSLCTIHLFTAPASMLHYKTNSQHKRYIGCHLALSHF